jgi:hypothetical protein
MNNMRQISPVRGAFFIYHTVSAYLKSEFEMIYARQIGPLRFFRALALPFRSIETA